MSISMAIFNRFLYVYQRLPRFQTHQLATSARRPVSRRSPEWPPHRRAPSWSCPCPGDRASARLVERWNSGGVSPMDQSSLRCWKKGKCSPEFHQIILDLHMNHRSADIQKWGVQHCIAQKMRFSTSGLMAIQPFELSKSSKVKTTAENLNHKPIIQRYGY